MEMKGAKAQGRDLRTRRLSYKYPTLVQVRLGIKDGNGLVANGTFNMHRQEIPLMYCFTIVGLTVSEKSEKLNLMRTFPCDVFPKITGKNNTLYFALYNILMRVTVSL